MWDTNGTMNQTWQVLIPSQQAAEYLGVSVKELERWRQNGKLVPRRIDRESRHAWYQIEALDTFLAAQAAHEQTSLYDEPNFTFIDLFAGIGGLRIGFDRLDGQCLFSSEIDKFACQTYNANFKEWPDGDITTTDVSEIPPHDVLIGGFPCQPFSIAGVSKYGSLGWGHGFQHQTKGTLFFDIVRILDHHRPVAFLLENVKNLKSHDRGKTWQVIYATLRELGYWVDERIYNARLLVPQHRERVFIVGFRDKPAFDRFEWPEIEDESPRLRNILDPEVDEKYTLTDHLWRYLQDYAAKHRRAGNGFGFGLADLDGVSRTLSARYYKDGSEILIPQDGKNPRRLTPRECARLMGFPETFKIPVSDTQAYKQFGNAVVVPLVSRLAASLIEALPEGSIAGKRDKQLQLLETD